MGWVELPEDFVGPNRQSLHNHFDAHHSNALFDWMALSVAPDAFAASQQH